MNHNGAHIVKGINEDGSLDINIQDQITPPVSSLFYRSLSNFTIASNTAVSTSETLVYTFTATAGHGITNGAEIILLDPIGDRSFICKVINVVTNTITVDRPIDWVFPAASTLGRIISSEMAVNGSVTPLIFTVRAGMVPVDYLNTILTIIDGSEMDDSLFGGIPALSKGLVLRIVDSYQRTIFNFKTNSDFRQFGGQLEYSSKAPSGSPGLIARFDFNGMTNLGVALRLRDSSVLQWVVQDDLRELTSLRASAQGHQTIGEVS